MNKKIIKNNIESICPKCYKKIKAKIIQIGQEVFMEKECEEDGKFLNIVEKDIKLYKASKNLNTKIKKPNRLDLPITHRCNLNCNFCFYHKRNKKDLSFEKIKKIINYFNGNFICLSGGEPTLRKDLIKIIKYISKRKKIPILITNGITLSNKKFVNKLKIAGTYGVNITLNSLIKDPFNLKNQKKIIELKLKALKNLKYYKINTILSLLIERERNENELKDIMNYILNNNDFISEFRIRSANNIGKHKEKNIPLLTSEILEKICNIIGENKKNLIDQYKNLKTKKCICKFSTILFFNKNIDNYLGSMSFNSYKQNIFQLFLQKNFPRNISKISSKFIKELNHLNFFIKKNSSNKFKGILSYLSNIHKIKSIKIEIRSWRNKYNVDLNEVNNCGTVGLCSDNNSLQGFCYRFFNKDEIKKQEY